MAIVGGPTPGGALEPLTQAASTYRSYTMAQLPSVTEVMVHGVPVSLSIEVNADVDKSLPVTLDLTSVESTELDSSTGGRRAFESSEKQLKSFRYRTAKYFERHLEEVLGPDYAALTKVGDDGVVRVNVVRDINIVGDPDAGSKPPERKLSPLETPMCVGAMGSAPTKVVSVPLSELGERAMGPPYLFGRPANVSIVTHGMVPEGVYSSSLPWRVGQSLDDGGLAGLERQLRKTLPDEFGVWVSQRDGTIMIEVISPVEEERDWEGTTIRPEDVPEVDPAFDALRAEFMEKVVGNRNDFGGALANFWAHFDADPHPFALNSMRKSLTPAMELAITEAGCGDIDLAMERFVATAQRAQQSASFYEERISGPGI